MKAMVDEHLAAAKRVAHAEMAPADVENEAVLNLADARAKLRRATAH